MEKNIIVHKYVFGEKVYWEKGFSSGVARTFSGGWLAYPEAKMRTKIKKSKKKMMEVLGKLLSYDLYNVYVCQIN